MAQDRRHRQNGAFTVTAVLTDTTAGLAQVIFPETVSPEATYPQEGAHQATVSHVYAFDADDDFSDDATVQATDRAGNEGQARFWVTRDAVSPTVTLDARVQDDAILVTWSAEDTSAGLDACTLAVRKEGEETWTQLTDSCEGSYTYTIAIPGQLYIFRFTATDNVGNETRAEAQAGIPRVTKYYYHGGQRVAMRVDEEGGDEVYYLHSDHLGSTSLVTLGEARHVGGGVVLPAGSEWSRQYHYPYGETRATGGPGTLPTDFTFAGQRSVPGTGLIFMHARYYHAGLGRFASADTIVPNPGNPQDLNRYSYVRNSPLNYIDPSGHVACVDEECNWIENPATGWISWRGPGKPSLPAGRYLYSEVYGWFDTSHLNTGKPGNVIANVRQAIANGGGEVPVPQAVGGRIPVLGKVQIRYIGTYQVSSDASAQDATRIALGIYMDWSHRFETWEGSFPFGFGNNTSYAIEDLPTHWIGFFAKAKGISPAEVFMNLGGVEGTNEEPLRDIKNRTFNPWVDDESVPWPSPLTITPIGSGPNTWKFTGARYEGFACNVLTDPNP